MLIWEYISTHETPEWCAARMSARESKGRLPAYEHPVRHAQACVGSMHGERDPLQLAEHSGDTAGVAPAIADIPGRTMLHHL